MSPTDVPAYYQLVVTMTEKGTHYHHGGAFVDIGEDKLLPHYHAKWVTS
jgi:hypothetical protein